jgi:DNA-binding phage protein
MALTREFKETVRERAQRDPAFRLALIEEAVESLLDGDLDSGKSILGNYINATIGYRALAMHTGRSEKSLMRMLGPNGNPTANNLFSILRTVKDRERIEFDVRVRQA